MYKVICAGRPGDVPRPAANPQELIALALALSQGGAVICHPADAPVLATSLVPARTLNHGGPQRGMLWVVAE